MRGYNSVWDGLKGDDMKEINALIGPNLGMSPRKKAKPVVVEPEDPNRLRGQITKFKDDRGFGFVQDDASGEEYFLHVSAFREGTIIRHRDRISFELKRDIRSGKTNAVNARIIR